MSSSIRPTSGSSTAGVGPAQDGAGPPDQKKINDLVKNQAMQIFQKGQDQVKEQMDKLFNPEPEDDDDDDDDGDGGL